MKDRSILCFVEKIDITDIMLTLKTCKKKEKDDELNMNRWHSDGKIPSVNSMQVLMDWLTDKENYNNYCGGKVNGHTDGKSKLAWCGEISKSIVDKGMIWYTFILF